MSNTDIKRYAMIIIGVAILIGTAVILVLYFTSATLTVKTSNASNTISIAQNLPTRRNVTIKQADGRTDIRVRPGTYTVFVKNGDRQTSQIVELSPGANKSINLDLPATVSVFEPVSSLSVIGVSADANDMKFIDVSTGDKFLYNVNKNNTISTIDSSNRYEDIKWASPSFGIGLALNKSNQYSIVRVENSKPIPQSLPFKAMRSTTVGVAKNKDWYISDRSSVYRVSSNGSFTKIYSVRPGFNVVVQSASDNAVLLIERRNNVTRGASSLIVINKQSEKYQIEGEIYESAWSNDGKRLAVSGDVTTIFDDKLNIVKSTPSSNFNSPTWLDNSSLVYSISNTLYRYDTNSGKASAIGSIPITQGQISQIYLSDANDYLYLVIQLGGNRVKTTFGLSRLGLLGQPQVNTLAQQLDVIIPNTIKDCQLDYINFVRTTILYKAPSKSTNCEAPARSYLSTYQIDSTPLNFQYFGSTK